LVDVISEMYGTSDSLTQVGNRPITPASDLISEETEAPEHFEANGTLGDNATPISVIVWDRSLLDDVASLGDSDLQRRVVEVTSWSVADQSRERLVQPAAHTHDVCVCAQRNPEEVDAVRSGR
jgi:hypothetical protein